MARPTILDLESRSLPKRRSESKTAAENGSRTKADDWTAYENAKQILDETPPNELAPSKAFAVTKELRRELQQKGLNGFKKGGPVKKTGPAMLHKGEYVVPAKAARSFYDHPRNRG
jgi:hypothetical protein